MFTINKNRILCSFFLKKKKVIWTFCCCKCHSVCVCAQLFSHVQLFAAPWTVACQGPLSMEFSRQEYWSGLPFPPPRNLPEPGMKLSSLASPALTGKFFTTGPPGKPCANVIETNSFSFFFFTHIYISKIILFHYGLSQDIQYSSLCYTLGPCCLSVLNCNTFLHLRTPNSQSISPCLLLGNHKSVLYVFKYVL